MRQKVSGTICSFLLSLLLFQVLLAPMALADDHRVEDKVETREEVEDEEYDGYAFTLEEGDEVKWSVNVVTGDDVDVFFMASIEYAKLKTGLGSPTYFSYYSDINVDYAEQSLRADDASWVGDFVVVVMTHKDTNASAQYDVFVKVDRSPPPQGLLDRLCGLGSTTCMIIFVVVVVVLLVLYWAYSKYSSGKAPGEKTDVKYVDSMMRPGFDIPIGPTAEETRPKRRKRKGPKRKKGKKGKKKKKKKKAPTVEELVVECPECGTHVADGEDSCPSCGAEFDYEQVLECPLCGHTNPPDAPECEGCGAEFE